MSDARSLLRQQRTARRTTHPHALYTDAGILTCTLCHIPVKTESLWDLHLNSETHKLHASKPQAQHQKRKHDSVDPDDQDQDDNNNNTSDLVRKRSRTNAIDTLTDLQQNPSTPAASSKRRSSSTPSHGIEVHIPSRPATPRDSISSTATTTSLPSRQASIIIAQDAVTAPTLAPARDADKLHPPQTQIDEDEWAAFEAEIQATTAYDDFATISAPAMTAAEAEAAAAKEGTGGGDDDPSKRELKTDIDLKEEKEDARRAFEEELDDMRELEAKVSKFKEQRDALRKRAASQAATTDGKARGVSAAAEESKENDALVVDGEDDEDDDDEDDDEDDWDGFRFRSGLAR